jgi:hypothetical protein
MNGLSNCLQNLDNQSINSFLPSNTEGSFQNNTIILSMLNKENLEDLYHHLTTEGLVKRDYSRSFEKEGMRIETVIPTCFEGYAKIMIPWSMNIDAPNKYFKEIPIDELYPDELYDLLFELHYKNKADYDAKIKEIQTRLEPYNREKQAFEDSINIKKVKNWRPVTWKEVCEIYEAHYHNDISPFSFDTKFKGVRYGLRYYESSPMQIDIITPLFEILKKHTKSNLLIWNENRKVEEVSIHQYSPPKNELWINYIPKKREWITRIGHDGYCVTVGGTYDLIDDLLNCKDLEVFECTPLSRVDWHSDKINN